MSSIKSTTSPPTGETEEEADVLIDGFAAANSVVEEFGLDNTSNNRAPNTQTTHPIVKELAVQTADIVVEEDEAPSDLELSTLDGEAAVDWQDDLGAGTVVERSEGTSPRGTKVSVPPPLPRARTSAAPEESVELSAAQVSAEPPPPPGSQELSNAIPELPNDPSAVAALFANEMTMELQVEDLLAFSGKTEVGQELAQLASVRGETVPPPGNVVEIERGSARFSLPPPVPERMRTQSMMDPPPVPERMRTQSMVDPPPWRAAATAAFDYLSQHASDEPNVFEEPEFGKPNAFERKLLDIRGFANERIDELRAAFEVALPANASTTQRWQRSFVGYELGVLLAAEQDPQAIKAFADCWRQMPTFRPALWEVRQELIRQQRWEKLLELVDAELQMVTSADEKIDLLFEKALLLEYWLSQPESALLVYERALDLAPKNIFALLSFERVAKALGKSAQAEKATGLLLTELLDSPRKTALQLEHARTCLAAGDFAGALAVFEQTLSAAANNVGDAGQLSAEERDLAWHRLAWQVGVSRRAGDPIRESEFLQREAEFLRQIRAADSDESAKIWQNRLSDNLARQWVIAQGDSAAKTALLVELADLTGNGGWFLPLLTESTNRKAEMPELATLAAQSSDPVWMVLATQIAMAKNPREAMNLWEKNQEGLRRGKVDFFDRLALTEALCAATSDDVTRRGEIFSRFAERANSPDQQYELQVWAGDCYWQAGAPQLAQEHYEEALAHKPSGQAGNLGTVACHNVQGQTDISESLLAEVHSEDPELHRKYLAVRAHLLDLRGDQRAADLWAACAKAAPEDQAIRWQVKRAALKFGHLDRYLSIAKQEFADQAKDEMAPVEPTVALAALHTAVGDEASAAQCLRLAAQSGRSSLAAAVHVATLRREQKWQDLAMFQEAAATKVDDEAVALAMLSDASNAFLRAKQWQDAIRVDEQIRERDPSHLLAVRRLAVAYEQTGDTAKLLQTLRDEADEQRQLPAKLYSLTRLALTAEKAGRREIAETAYQEILGLDGENIHALVALWAFAKASKNTAKEKRAIAQLANALPPSDVRAEFLLERAWLELAEGQADAAKETFLQALILVPHHAGALWGLVLCARVSEDEFACAEAMTRLAEVTSDTTQASVLYTRSALLADAQGDEALLSERLASALRVNPSDRTAQIAYTEAEAQFWGQSPNGEALRLRAQAYGDRANLSSDAAAIRSFHLEQAESLERAGDTALAEKLVLDVLAERPGDLRALFLLRRICARGNSVWLLAITSVSIARRLQSPEGRLVMFRQAHDLLVELGKEQEELAVLAEIVALNPGCPEFARYVELLQKYEDDGGLYRAITARRASADDSDPPELRAKYWAMRAKLCFDCQEWGHAKRDCQRALRVHPDPTAHWLMSLLCEKQSDRQGQRAHLAEILAIGEMPTGVSKYQVLRKRIAASDDAGEAMLCWAELAAQPESNDDVLAEWLEKAEASGQWGVAHGIAKRLLGKAESQAKQLELIRKLAAWEAGPLADVKEAKKTLAKARQLAPSDPEILRLSAEIESERKHALYDQAIAELRRQIAGTPEDPQLYTQLANFCTERGDADSAGFSRAAAQLLTGKNVSANEMTPLDSVLPANDWLLLTPGKETLHSRIWLDLQETVEASLLVTPPAPFNKNDRLKTKDVERRYPRLHHLLRLLGITYDFVWVSSAVKTTAWGSSGESNELFVSADWADCAESSARYYLAKTGALLRSGMGGLSRLSSEEVSVAFGAAGIVFSKHGTAPEFCTSTTLEKAQQTATILSAKLPRKARKNLQALGNQWEGLTSPEAWFDEWDTLGRKIGLLLSGDLQHAIKKHSPGTDYELLAWAVSAEHMHLRKSLGWRS